MKRTSEKREKFHFFFMLFLRFSSTSFIIFLSQNFSSCWLLTTVLFALRLSFFRYLTRVLKKLHRTQYFALNYMHSFLYKIDSAQHLKRAWMNESHFRWDFYCLRKKLMNCMLMRFRRLVELYSIKQPTRTS